MSLFIGQVCHSPAELDSTVLVVDLVADADVAKGYKVLALDAFEKIAPVDEVFAAEREQVASVGALWGSGETEKKLGLEVVDEAPVGAGRGVMELVDDDVVEALRAEVSKVCRLSESLDRGERARRRWGLCRRP